MNKLGASLIGSLLFAGALALISCNGDTGTAGSGNVLGSSAPGPGTGPVPVAGPTGTRIQLLASNPQMPSSGATLVDLTAIVVDANGQAVSGASVVFSTGTDPSALINTISGSPAGVSDSNGTVTAKLALGSNKSNRFISVSASTQGATASTGVDVTGTAITVSGNSSIAFGAPTTLTFSLKDSAGVAVPGFQMTLVSAVGNSISPAAGPTNSAGQVVATVTGTVGGNDTITATAAGASKTQALTVSSAGFAFTAPTPSVDIPLNTPTAISVHWTNGGAAVVGQAVTFATSRGTITGNPSTTDVAGNTPGVSISSTSAGTATVSASGPGGTPAATLNVTFVATTASTVAAQAVPGTIQVTTGVGSQTSNKATISVIVRDAANNLVKNAGVNFTVTADPTAGSLGSARAITDVTGAASVTYTAGSVSSPQNGVAIQATVTDVNGVPVGGPAVTDTATLTVSGQSLLVRLGTDNLVQPVPPLNKKTWVAVVTDAGGNAVAGVTVNFALRPGRYLKGVYDKFDDVLGVWVRSVPPTVCQNEDKNFNGNVDPGEDNDPVNGNNNGSLEPGGAATVNTTGITDASGIATAVITYPKDHATWAEYSLEARTGVTSNDPPTVATFILVGLASDYTNKTVPPPGQNSPYGVATVCTNPK
jgi:hypothetical protein